MKKLETLRPFKRLCVTIGNLPTSFVESMTYYECLVWLVKYLEDTVIPAVNNNAEATKELQDAFTILKNYVDNYFDNLDVQEEINNKLDDLVEDGTMERIINEQIFEELNTKINTATTNIGNLENLDTTNKETLVSAINEVKGMSDDNNDKIGDLQELDTTNKENLVSAVNEVKDETDTKAKALTHIVVFGDSWSDPTSLDAIWATDEYIGKKLNLIVNNYALSGSYLSGTDSTSLQTQVDTFRDDDTYDKDVVKYIVILGGINDFRNNIDYHTLSSKITQQVQRLETMCPQAKILFVSNCQYYYGLDQARYWIGVHQDISADAQISSYNMCGTLGQEMFNTNNYFHLNQTGQKFMMGNIISCLTGGEIQYFQDDIVLENSDAIAVISSQRIKNMVYIHFEITAKQNFTSTTLNRPTGFYLPYYEQLGGWTDRNYKQIAYDLDYDKLIIACETGLSAGVTYGGDCTIPLSHT